VVRGFGLENAVVPSTSASGSVFTGIRNVLLQAMNGCRLGARHVRQHATRSLFAPERSAVGKHERVCRPGVVATNVARVGSVGAQLPRALHNVHFVPLVDSFLTKGFVVSKALVGVAVIHDGLYGRKEMGLGVGSWEGGVREGRNAIALGTGTRSQIDVLQHTPSKPTSVACIARHI
jgi:hypothetical protein